MIKLEGAETKWPKCKRYAIAFDCLLVNYSELIGGMLVIFINQWVQIIFCEVLGTLFQQTSFQAESHEKIIISSRIGVCLLLQERQNGKYAQIDCIPNNKQRIDLPTL